MSIHFGVIGGPLLASAGVAVATGQLNGARGRSRGSIPTRRDLDR
jgi:hypothetical protein